MRKRLYAPSPGGESEDPECYHEFRFFPVMIGDYLKDGRYKIVHKLGSGSFSTIWLARDTSLNCYVSAKIEERDDAPESNEWKILHYLNQERSISKHDGRKYIMELLDSFHIPGPKGIHRCYISHVGGRRLSIDEPQSFGPSLRYGYQIAQAVDLLHESGVAHGGKIE